ncbi:type II toxin-antitoxin system VapC family toxin [Allorhizobium pseudoryzae]|uniref:type II toxin-antitoxin system VapC family toxin n=1 Tax=Allorhizobium pseudoryzae TaxID=379684 RepID=UPI003D001CED
MKVLADTHTLAWFAEDAAELTADMRAIIEDDENILFFSSASIWELAIKKALKKVNFRLEPRTLHRALLINGFEELSVTSFHALLVETLPPIHKDPFDRLLIAQATHEDMLLLTSDATVAQYEGPIRLV